MCGRFALTATPEEVEAMYALLELGIFPPRYNIAPTQPVLTVMAAPPREPGSNLPDRQAVLARWGLIPRWAKNPNDLPLLINARAETVAEKAAFKAAMRHRRALIPASGFYEWRREKGKTGQAYWIRPRRGGLVAFAGLMETWLEPGGSEIDTAAILTTAANDDVAAIHDRMPVVIGPEDFSRWLDCRSNEPRDVADLLRPAEPGLFEAVPVSSAVNKVANMGPELQDRAEQEAAAPKVAASTEEKAEPPKQMSLF
jgi:putative SOS response-associated peptidase YedK